MGVVTPVVPSNSSGRRSRRSLPIALGLLVIGFVAALGSPAYAVLPGSNFQGNDGNQTDQAPFIDWQSLAAVGRVTTIDDPNAADTSFSGGDKEEAPIDWNLGTETNGVNPPKDNVFTAWASLDQTASATFLYLAFVREETGSNGDTYLTFELNQSSATWVNAEGSTIPCRTAGDLAISYNVGGNLAVSFTVYQWVPAAPTDPSLGCPEGQTGTWQPLSVGSNAEGAMNVDGPIANFLSTSAPYDGEFPQGTFGEAAVNLTALLSGAGVSPCVNFVQVQVHSRSSIDINSQLQDLLGPTAFTLQTCTATGTKFNDLNGNGARELGEPGVAGWTFFVDYNGNGTLDPGEPTAVSDASGNFTFSSVDPGAWTVREVPQPGWTCTFPHPNCFYVRTFTAGTTSGLLFGNTAAPPPPPPTAAPPAAAPPPQQPPAQVVPGSSNAVGPSRCVQRTFAVRITGRNIARVIFFIDGKRVKTVSQPDRQGRFILRVDITRYNRKPHKLRAQVFYTDESRTASTTKKLSFKRCAKAKAKPRFTG
jgi:hypothetical protein